MKFTVSSMESPLIYLGLQKECTNFGGCAVSIKLNLLYCNTVLLGICICRVTVLLNCGHSSSALVLEKPRWK